MEVDEGSDQKSDILPHWMAAHVRLKNEFTEDEKYGTDCSGFTVVLDQAVPKGAVWSGFILFAILFAPFGHIPS